MTEKKEIDIDCWWCTFEGIIKLTERDNAGIFYEDKDRMHVLGVCPSCDHTLISYFYTREHSV